MDTHQHINSVIQDEAVVSVVGHRGDLLWFHIERLEGSYHWALLVYFCVRWSAVDSESSMAMNPEQSILIIFFSLLLCPPLKWFMCYRTKRQFRGKAFFLVFCFPLFQLFLTADEAIIDLSDSVEHRTEGKI